MFKFIEFNTPRIAVVTLCGCIGYFMGNAVTGIVVGLTIIASCVMLAIFVGKR